MNFVVSLGSAKERRVHIGEEFGKNKIDFEFFNAITPEDLEIYEDRQGIKTNKKLLGLGERACLHSHVEIWMKALELGVPFISVFEDDIYLGKDASNFLQTYDWIAPNCDIIKLEMFSRNVSMSLTSKRISCDRKLKVLKAKHLGTAGYILSLKGAESLLNYVRSHEVSTPIDRVMFEEYLANGSYPIYQMVPALVIQSKIYGDNIFESELEVERDAKKALSNPPKKIKLNLTLKILREIKRIKNLILKKIGAIDFK
jgi:glycosyl transferase, family 25